MEALSLTNQERLSALLKKKGIGPEGSKSLKQDEIEEIKILFHDPQISMTTKATMLTAFLTLEATPVEGAFIESVKQNPPAYLPVELTDFISGETSSDFLKIILGIISHNDLNEQEATLAMDYFFGPNQPDYLKGAFLEAERLKRESFLENEVFFQSLWKRVEQYQIDSPILIDIADSYDGCNRTRHFSPFVAALLASAGFPTYLHSLDKVAPKEAVTAHQILKAAGKNPLKTKEHVVADILNPEIRWGHIDQQVFFPELYALKNMRKEMVKRPFLATFEKLLQPIQSMNGNLIVTGYTHAHYKEELVKQLQKQKQCNQALVIKGVEGSTQLSMSRESVIVHFDGKEIIDATIHPGSFNLPVFNASRDMSITPEVSLNEGVEALKGKEGFARENIIYTAAIILSKFKLVEEVRIINLLKECIDSGKALAHWERGCQ